MRSSSRFSVDAMALLRKLPTPKPDVRDAIADSLEEQLQSAQRLEKSLREHLADTEQERDENGRGWLESQEQYEALQESYRALHRQWNDGQEALEWIADWPHVKLYKGNETAYMPLIVHERATKAAALRGNSNPASRLSDA